MSNSPPLGSYKTRDKQVENLLLNYDNNLFSRNYNGEVSFKILICSFHLRRTWKI